tara:strand:- start:178 stop:624 length:447 start_codon:yes stop_codon:yes gene_type:complete
MEIAILALGCFWGPEEKFSKVEGVLKTEVGYCGGNRNSTTYEEVCTGSTNHAEVVKIEFDEKIITYDNLLKKFFEMHDPTTLNRQGPDIGTQYRSEIFFTNDNQKIIAEDIKSRLNKKFNGKITTNISKEKNYCKAEDYHQKYIQKRN